MAIYSIGHSSLTAEDFGAALLNCTKIRTFIDVRSHPTSRLQHWRYHNLRKWLPALGIKYESWLELGGWTAEHLDFASEFREYGVDIAAHSLGYFPKQHITKNKENETADDKPRFTNLGLYEYSWFTVLDSFQRGVYKLIDRAKYEDVVIVCSEALNFKCHRSIISDCLGWLGVEVIHLQPRFRKIKKPREVMSEAPHSKFLAERLLRYDDRIIKRWEKFKSSQN